MSLKTKPQMDADMINHRGHRISSFFKFSKKSIYHESTKLRKREIKKDFFVISYLRGYFLEKLNCYQIRNSQSEILRLS